MGAFIFDLKGSTSDILRRESCWENIAQAAEVGMIVVSFSHSDLVMTEPKKRNLYRFSRYLWALCGMYYFKHRRRKKLVTPTQPSKRCRSSPTYISVKVIGHSAAVVLLIHLFQVGPEIMRTFSAILKSLILNDHTAPFRNQPPARTERIPTMEAAGNRLIKHLASF